MFNTVSTKFTTLRSTFAENLFFRWAVLVVIASSVSYMVAGVIPHASPSIAAFTAAIMVQGTVHESVKLATSQFAGVVLGAVLGLGLVYILGGLSVVALIIATITSFIFAKLAKMDIHSAVSMVVPIIVIVGGQYLSVFTLEERVLGVAVGIVIALVASFTTKRGTPTERIVVDLKDINLEISKVLSEVSYSISSGEISKSKTLQWETSNAKCLIDVFHLRSEAEDVIKGSKYSPFIKRKEAEKTLKESEKTLSTVMVSINMVETYKNTYGEELKESARKKTKVRLAHPQPNPNDTIEPTHSLNTESYMVNEDNVLTSEHLTGSLVSSVRKKKKTTKVSRKHTSRKKRNKTRTPTAHLNFNDAPEPKNTRESETTELGFSPAVPAGELVVVRGTQSTEDVVKVDNEIPEIISEHIKTAAELISKKAPSLNKKGELLTPQPYEDELVQQVMLSRENVKELIKESEKTKELKLGGSIISNMSRLTEDLLIEEPDEGKSA